MISYFIKKDGSFPDKWLHLPDSQTNGFIRLIPRLSPSGDGLGMRLAGTLQQVSIRLVSAIETA